ncbi:hypothetical protein LCGC14_3045970, partial [marine sediment metagenome]
MPCEDPDLVCPKCDERGVLDVKGSVVECTNCGWFSGVISDASANSYRQNIGGTTGQPGDFGGGNP